MKLFGLRRVSLPQQSQGVRLIVVEADARELDSRVDPDESDETVLLAQLAGETPRAFALRVDARLSAIERSHRTLASSVLVLAGRRDASAADARTSIADALLSRMTAQEGGGLAIAAHEVVPEVRHELLAFVERLLDRHSENHVPIRLQFHADRREAPPESGVQHVAPAPLATKTTPANGQLFALARGLLGRTVT